MVTKTLPLSDRNELRARAVSHLHGAVADASAYLGSHDALGVLYDLASSPATAAKALALLHELQVHQVEVDLQDEELRRAHAEMETALTRQMQLYEAMPVAYLSIEPDTTVREVNPTAERVFGQAREILLGRKLESMIAPEAQQVLHGMLARLMQSSGAPTHGSLPLAGPGTPRLVHASASRDPAGGRFLLTLAETTQAD